MRNQFVKMPRGLPKLALLLTLRPAAADKAESKPGASLEPDTTLSATAAPTPFGGCCKWSSASDWCETCDDLATATDWCSYSRANCENCGAAVWCGIDDVAPVSYTHLTLPTTPYV